MSEKNVIKVCLGSACFARGNEENLDFIEKFIRENRLDAKVEITGSRCENLCAKGPNIEINGTIYNNITSDRLTELMEGLL